MYKNTMVLLVLGVFGESKMKKTAGEKNVTDCKAAS